MAMSVSSGLLLSWMEQTDNYMDMDIGMKVKWKVIEARLVGEGHRSKSPGRDKFLCLVDIRHIIRVWHTYVISISFHIW